MLRRPTIPAPFGLSLVLVLLPLRSGAGEDPLAAGLEAYAAGDVARAAELWTGAAEEQGEDAGPRLHLNAAIAALALGQIDVAQAQTAAARAKVDEALAPACDFLLAHVAFARSLDAVRVLQGPEAGPADLDRALGLASVAREYWQRAALARIDWEMARRNAERAQLLLEALQQRQDRMVSERKTLATPEVRIHRQPGSTQEPEAQDPAKTSEEGRDEALRQEPESVEAVFERLREREQARRARQQEARGRAAGRGERDW